MQVPTLFLYAYKAYKNSTLEYYITVPIKCGIISCQKESVTLEHHELFHSYLTETKQVLKFNLLNFRAHILHPRCAKGFPTERRTILMTVYGLVYQYFLAIIFRWVGSNKNNPYVQIMFGLIGISTVANLNYGTLFNLRIIFKL